ncbi:MAG: hypothetical protein ABFD97_24580 [Syntrophobacter sp.]
MRILRIYARIFIVMSLLSLVPGLPASIMAGEEIRFDGSYTIAPNGDVSTSVKLTPPMVLYQKLRESFSNLYLVLRAFASSRADYEVADKKADWDDPNRTMVFSMKMLGACRNLGNRWELEIPKGAEFINMDEGKRTLYFNETTEAGEMATIRGTSRMILPAQATQFSWDGSRRVVTYTLPAPKVQSGRNYTLLISAIILILAGAAMAAVSFRMKTEEVRVE